MPDEETEAAGWPSRDVVLDIAHRLDEMREVVRDVTDRQQASRSWDQLRAQCVFKDAEIERLRAELEHQGRENRTLEDRYGRLQAEKESESDDYRADFRDQQRLIGILLERAGGSAEISTKEVEAYDGALHMVTASEDLDLVRYTVVRAREPVVEEDVEMHCCETMAGQVGRVCLNHFGRECPDGLVHHRRGTYGLVIRDGGGSFVKIQFCPWCGADLMTGKGATS